VAYRVVDEAGWTLDDVGTPQDVTLHELGGVAADWVVHAALAALARVGGQAERVCNTRNILYNIVYTCTKNIHEFDDV
jgi:hypothetical protein